MKISKSIKIYALIGTFLIIVLFYFNFNNIEVENDFLLKEVESISEASNLIEKSNYLEAIKILNNIESVDLYYLKNQYLGDIAYIKKDYENSISFYNLAQIHAKDQIMYDYIKKRVSYIETVKLKKGS